MKQSIRILASCFFKPVGYEENLVRRKRTFLQEMAVIYRCMGVIDGYWRWLLMTIAMGMLWSTLGVLFPWLEKIVYDQAFPNKDWNLFFFIIAAWFLIDFQGMAVSHVNGTLNKYFDLRAGLWLQMHFYRHLQSISLTHLQRKGVGEHMYRMWEDVVGILVIAKTVINTLIQEFYALLMTFFFLLFIDPRLAFISLSFALLSAITSWIYTTYKQKVKFLENAAKEKSQARLQEGVAAALTVKVYGRINHEVSSYLHTVSRLQRVSALNMFITQFYALTVGSLFWAKDLFIISFLYYQVITEQMSYGMVFVITAYLSRLDDPIEQLVKAVNGLRARIVPAERFFQTWDLPPAVVDRKNARKPSSFKGDIEIRKAGFSYEDGVQVLHDLSFQVDRGKFAAIVGHSGSGKSTVMNLLMRLYDPQTGSVLVDGMDLKDMNHIYYQKRIGVVLQDTFVFKGTLYDNLNFSTSSASEEDMVQALEKVQLGHFLRRLPQGLRTDLQEGSKLSVGERQRLGIARAVLRNPDIWLLDEPTSSLDLRTEKEIMELLSRLCRGKTTIMVTHRLNTVEHADQIFYMEKGRIGERGTLPELLANKAAFRRMYDLFIDDASLAATVTLIPGVPGVKSAANPSPKMPD